MIRSTTTAKVVPSVAPPSADVTVLKSLVTPSVVSAFVVLLVKTVLAEKFFISTTISSSHISTIYICSGEKAVI